MCYDKFSGSNRWNWILSKKVKYENMSKKCHITLIKSIRLESVKFILPKRLSSPKIVHTICLINEGNFSVALKTSISFQGPKIKPTPIPLIGKTAIPLTRRLKEGNLFLFINFFIYWFIYSFYSVYLLIHSINLTLFNI